MVTVTAHIHNLKETEQFFSSIMTMGNNLPSWLIFAFLIYLVGLLGMVFNYKNFLVTMMSVEMMYLGAVSSFVLFATATHDSRGAIYGLLLLILAACESAIGLGILIVLYRFGRTVDFNSYQQLGG